MKNISNMIIIIGSKVIKIIIDINLSVINCFFLDKLLIIVNYCLIIIFSININKLLFII